MTTDCTGPSDCAETQGVPPICKTPPWDIERQLHAICPAAFSRPAKPLKIGITHDLVALFDGEMSHKAIRQFIKWWCRRDGYLIALARGDDRVDLDGFPVARPTDEQRALARAILDARGIEA